MNFKKHNSIAVILLGFCLLAGQVMMVRASQQNAQEPAPDNTKINQRDRDKSSPTADQQKVNAPDQNITKKIRAAIHDDNSLSTYAHNVKIITQNGKVTLRGPVQSDTEKANIATKAAAVVGEGNVDNQLDVMPAKQ